MGMRATWDALACGDVTVYVGDPRTARSELESLFGRLGADPHGGTCVEIGCGPGRMTGLLAERFDRVRALDVSPAMIERARQARANAEDGHGGGVTFSVIGGERLDGVPDACADAVVCYLVLQHLPSRRLVEGYLSEIGRVLAPAGEAFVQLPVLDGALVPRAWRAVRSLALPLLARVLRDPRRAPALRGVRLTRGELRRALSRAGLRVVAHDVGPDAPYRFATDVFLRLQRVP